MKILNLLIIIFFVNACNKNNSKEIDLTNIISSRLQWQMISELPKMKNKAIINMCKGDPSFYKDEFVEEKDLKLFKEQNNYQNIYINKIGYIAYKNKTNYPIGTSIYVETLNLVTKRIDIDIIKIMEFNKWIIIKGMSSTIPFLSLDNLSDSKIYQQ